MAIKHVIDTGSNVKVFDENDRQLSSSSKNSDEIVVAWGKDFFVTKSEDYLKTYDEDCRSISSEYVSYLSKATISVNNMGYVLVQNDNSSSTDCYTRDLKKMS